MHGIVACVNAGGCAIITLAVAGVADLLACMDAFLRECMHSCVHACTLACGLPDGRPGENMRMPDIKVFSPHITMYIESGARNGSAAFYWSSSGGWMGVPIRNIRHTASWRCEIAGSGGAARMAELLIAATTRAPARHRRDIVLGAESEYAHTTHHAPIGRASTTLSQPDVSLQKTLHMP